MDGSFLVFFLNDSFVLKRNRKTNLSFLKKFVVSLTKAGRFNFYDLKDRKQSFVTDRNNDNPFFNDR